MKANIYSNDTIIIDVDDELSIDITVDADLQEVAVSYGLIEETKFFDFSYDAAEYVAEKVGSTDWHSLDSAIVALFDQDTDCAEKDLARFLNFKCGAEDAQGNKFFNVAEAVPSDNTDHAFMADATDALGNEVRVYWKAVEGFDFSECGSDFSDACNWDVVDDWYVVEEGVLRRTGKWLKEGGRSKAKFRALREMVGLSQQDLANELGVNVKTVKRWEAPSWPEPPHDAWMTVLRAKRRQDFVVQAVLDMLPEDIEEELPPFVLTYYRSQEQFDAFGRDEGSYTMANANARAVATVLDSLGADVDFRYPDDEDNPFHRNLAWDDDGELRERHDSGDGDIR